MKTKLLICCEVNYLGQSVPAVNQEDFENMTYKQIMTFTPLNLQTIKSSTKIFARSDSIYR